MPESAERFLHTRIARSVEAILPSFIDNLFCITGRTLEDAIPNVSRSGRFSSDRAIREYSEDIWRVSQLPVASKA
jgi:glucan phosphorylase